MVLSEANTQSEQAYTQGGVHRGEVETKLQDLHVGGKGKIGSYFLSTLSSFETCHFYYLYSGQ